jgi:hypothetical protein
MVDKCGCIIKVIQEKDLVFSSACSKMTIKASWKALNKIRIILSGITDCIGSCQSNYHRITPTTAPNLNLKMVDKCGCMGYFFAEGYSNMFTPVLFIVMATMFIGPGVGKKNLL